MPHVRLKDVTRSAVAAFALVMATHAGAQSWPVKPVRVIVPFAPGGGADLTARPISQKLSESLGQQFVVDNRGGAAGAIGMELTAKAPPDGYTLISVSGSFSVTAATRKMGFDPMDAIIPVVEIGYTPNVLVVHPSLPSKTTKEFIALARAHPGQLVYASTGIGGLTHMATELFDYMAKIKMVHVPYKSTGAAMPELLSGQVQVMVAGMLAARPFFDSGKVRALAVTTAQRWPALPAIPAIAETLPGYEAGTYYGILAPKGTPQPIVDRINAEVNRILQDGGIKKTLEAQGMAPSGGTPAKFGERVKKEYDGWVKVVREAQLKVE
ncbi:MAG TPA: tripartite tricarboxylate transporter substrate binding protein [Burkholderiales bacterium]|nr:tripartite tricarboxylate transporter substrate binding protein [Burkholderiales bacterium]